MSMSRKDYRAIAREVNVQLAQEKAQQCVRCILAISRMTRRLANYLQADNPRFNRDRFYSAAGIDRDDSHNL